MVNLATDEQFDCSFCPVKRWHTPACVESAIERDFYVLYIASPRSGRYHPMGFGFEDGITMCIGCALDVGWIDLKGYRRLMI